MARYPRKLYGFLLIMRWDLALRMKHLILFIARYLQVLIQRELRLQTAMLVSGGSDLLIVVMGILCLLVVMEVVILWSRLI